MWSKGVDNGLTTPPVQSIHEYSATQNYPLGQKFWYREKCFKYARAGGTLVVDRLCTVGSQQVSGYAAPPTATDAGTDEVWATIGATEGIAGEGTVAKDELVGASVVIMLLNAGAAETTYTFYIEGNTAVASGGGTTLLTIDQPLPFANSTSSRLEITANPYRLVMDGAASIGQHGGGIKKTACMGLPMSPMTTTYPYGWLQTAGPCWISCAGTVGTGEEVVAVFAAANGSLTIGGTTATTLNKQYVGYTYTRANAALLEATGQGTPLIYLFISS